MIKFLAKILCWLNRHKPNGRIKLQGYVKLSTCIRCNEPIVKDMHWETTDENWRALPKEYR